MFGVPPFGTPNRAEVFGLDMSKESWRICTAFCVYDLNLLVVPLQILRPHTLSLSSVEYRFDALVCIDTSRVYVSGDYS